MATYFWITFQIIIFVVLYKTLKSLIYDNKEHSIKRYLGSRNTEKDKFDDSNEYNYNKKTDVTLCENNNESNLYELNEFIKNIQYDKDKILNDQNNNILEKVIRKKEYQIVYDDNNPDIDFFTNNKNLKIARYTWKAKTEKPKAYIFALHGIRSHLRNQYLIYYGRPIWVNENEEINEEYCINDNMEIDVCESNNIFEIEENNICDKKVDDNLISRDNLSSDIKDKNNDHNENDIRKLLDDDNVLLHDENENDYDIYRNLYYCSKCGLCNYCDCGKRTLSYENSWVQSLNQNGYTFCGIDIQSHGLSDASRNERCFVEKFDNFVTDAVQALEIFINEWEMKNELRPIILLGSSMGGCVAIKMFEHLYEKNKEWKKYIKGLALVSPMICVDNEKKSLRNRIMVGLGSILRKIIPLYKLKFYNIKRKYHWITLDDIMDPYYYYDDLKGGIALECVLGADSCMTDKILNYIDESDIDIIIFQSKFDRIVDPIGSLKFVNKMVNIYNKKDEEKNLNINKDNNNNKKKKVSLNCFNGDNYESDDCDDNDYNDNYNNTEEIKNNEKIFKNISHMDFKNTTSDDSYDDIDKSCKHKMNFVVLSGQELRDEDILWKPCIHGHYKNYKIRKNMETFDFKNKDDKENYKHLCAHILNYGSHALSSEPDNKETCSILTDWINDIV
ncbi:alpha/beta hydrolase,putative [Plasmodium gaboni]|uniref:Alpha/beta hydrolase,putative n=1 Tax=Plasmodium gaboni TaxID=647221 RepID=A0ABY0KWI5_9APIC|nr:alpha/beta hydrolase,putative [Plasmodium gaboni]